MRAPNRQDYAAAVHRAAARPRNKQLQREAREAIGGLAFLDGKDRIGGHRAPCAIVWCERPECAGYKRAARVEKE